jgi:[acyl-carrier-protein] S-malonyltransferase
MGKDVIAARPDLLGSAAQEVLGWSLAELCQRGPESELIRTDRAQPALYAVSFALWEAFSVRAPHPPVAAAGHSLGEYTAVAASNAISYMDGLRLVAARGRAMALAAKEKPGNTAAVVGADLDTVEEAVAALRMAGGSIWVANINAPGQIVVAGSSESVDYLAANAHQHGLRRVIALKVSGAFHTPLMEPARVQLESLLAEIDFRSGDFPVWTNLEATPVAEPTVALSGQLVGKVRFSESLVAMSDAGVEAFVHIGPGDVTAGMAKRSISGAKVITVSSLTDIAAAVEELAE